MCVMAVDKNKVKLCYYGIMRRMRQSRTVAECGVSAVAEIQEPNDQHEYGVRKPSGHVESICCH